MKPSRFLIYALQDPLTWEIRYVGRSCTGLSRPNARHTGHCGSWCAKFRRWGHRPLVHVLQVFSDSDDINDVLNGAERTWVAELRLRGCPLTNLTDGGGGATGWKASAETLQRMSESQLRSWASNPSRAEALRRPEVRAKISASLTGKSAAPATRRLMSVSQLLRGPRSVETRARMSAAQRGRSRGPLSDQHRQHLSDSLKGRLPSPLAIARGRESNLGRPLTPEHRAKLAEAKRGSKNPNFGKSRPTETIERMRAAQRQRWAQIRARG